MISYASLIHKVWKMMTGELEREISVDFLAMSSCLCSNMESNICVVIGSSQSFLYIDITNRCIIKYFVLSSCECRRLDLHSQVNAIASYKQYTIAGTNDVTALNLHHS